MTTSGLSPEAKEFVPLIQIPPPTTIPLYIDENYIQLMIFIIFNHLLNIITQS